MMFGVGRGFRIVPSKPPNQHTASSTAFQASSPAASSHDSRCFDIEARSPVPISAINVYSSVLKLKLKVNTSGNRSEPGICDLRGGIDFTGVKADDGEAGGEAAERRAGVLTGAANLGAGVLTTFALGVSLETDCDFA